MIFLETPADLFEPGERRGRSSWERDVSSGDSLSAKAYRHLHNEIMSGRIGVGDVISELAIAKSLGISRTPVGEAVRLLAREGLVHQVPRYGTVVRRLERADLEEHYELREALESYATAQAARRASPTDVNRIRELCEATGRWLNERAPGDHQTLSETELRQFLAADMAFHLAIVQAAGNRQIMNAVHASRSILRIFALRRQQHDRDLVLDAYQQHCSIANAIAKGDGQTASTLMLQHIRQSKQSTLEWYDLEARRGQIGMPGLPADVQHELNEVEELLTKISQTP